MERGATPLLPLAQHLAPKVGREAEVLLREWSAQLARHPDYLRRWLEVAAMTDAAAVEILLGALGWVGPVSKARPIEDPGHARREAAWARYAAAIALFGPTPLSAAEQLHFERAWAQLSDEVEKLLWRRTSDAVFLALLNLLGLSPRAAPPRESPGGA